MLFIAVDDLNDWIGPLGGHSQTRTPNLDRLAARGMLFTNAHCSYALCNPSRASVMSGLLPSTSGVFGNQQDWRKSVRLQGKETLPEYFRNRGYWTGAAGKIYHANHGGPEGALTGGHGGRRGFNHPASWSERYPSKEVQIPDLVVRTGQNWNGLDIWHWDWGPLDHPDSATVDGRCSDWAIEQLKRKHTRPFFLALGIYAPHGPWYCPRPYFDRHPVDQIKLPVLKEDDRDDLPPAAPGPTRYHELILENNLYPAAVQAYLAQITFADATIGRVIDALDCSPHAANTIVCLWSDHGWYLGEKERWHKGGLWEEATRVPLLFVVPGMTEAGSVCKRPVSLVDLYPTLLELCGLPSRDDLDGISLVPLLKDPNAPRQRPAITISGGGERASYAVRTERWRYIRYADGGEELYDHDADPNEWYNLAGGSKYSGVKRKLAGWIPRKFATASRPVSQIKVIHTKQGWTRYHLEDGDRLEGKHAPNVARRPLKITARLTPAYPDGAILAQGANVNGWALYFSDGKPAMTVRSDGAAKTVQAESPARGTFNLSAEIDRDGRVTLKVNDRTVAAGNLSGLLETTPNQGLTVGGPTRVLDDELRIVGFDGKLQNLVLEVGPLQQSGVGAK